jgi:hypothetical protein
VRDEPVRVEAHAGHRGAERPLAFFLDEKRIEVAEIIRTWIEEEKESRERRRFFQVRGDDGNNRLLYYHETLKVWFHRLPGARPSRT